MDDYAMFGSPVMNSKGITSVIITTKSFTGWQLGNFSTNITNNSNDFISLIVDIDLNGNWTDLHTFLIPNTPTNSYLPMQFATLGVLTNDTIIMAYHTNDDMTIIDGINHFNLPQHLTEVGSVSVITRLGHDADNDSILDHLDNCISITNTLQLDRDGDNIGDECELDDDDDGVIDTLDDCPRGDIDWTSNSTSDHDSDGCKDSSEDNDDDNDGIVDTIDDCPTGLLNWTSTQNNDYDGDGCEDSQEDLDDDNDLVADLDDNCIFTANPSQNNYDLDTFGDACDEDDDNDTIIDFVDDCPTGEIGWNSSIETDRDGDGCRDESEDLDDDNDLVLDDIDDCKDSITMGWTTGGSQDHDMDGCRDSDQDDDDDNDGIEDSADDCPRGDLNWISSPTTDTDGDGCQDSSEDGDDDNDKVQDDSDSCTIGGLEWESSPSTDYDSDGCEDSTQDDDDDNDQVLDLIDDCPKGQIGWNGSNPLEDRDGDGCEDSTEDDDDDNDGFNDDEDNCIITWGNTTVAPYIGCPDSDGDGVSDSQDALPFDPDYTRDDDNDGFGDDGENPDDCPTKQGTSTRDRIGCIDSDGDGYSDADSIWSVEMGADRFPQDKSKWSDSDQDGYADQFEDLCKNIFGNSSEDRLGCPDSDGDGYSDSDDSWAISAGADAFSDDSTQWVSRDGDRFGDNPNGTTPDTCPDEFGTSQRNSIYGCPDRDGDYVDDVSDIFIDDPLQWSDADGDGYSDQRNSANYDDCQLTFGTSTKGEKGCSDRDGDGWSDWTDVAPDDIKVWQKSQISETPWLLIISIIVIISLSTILIIRKKRKSIID